MRCDLAIEKPWHLSLPLLCRKAETLTAPRLVQITTADQLQAKGRLVSQFSDRNMANVEWAHLDRRVCDDASCKRCMPKERVNELMYRDHHWVQHHSRRTSVATALSAHGVELDHRLSHWNQLTDGAKWLQSSDIQHTIRHYSSTNNNNCEPIEASTCTFLSNVPSKAATITTLPALAASSQNSTSCIDSQGHNVSTD